MPELGRRGWINEIGGKDRSFPVSVLSWARVCKLLGRLP
jgi:hypothetical protein